MRISKYKTITSVTTISILILSALIFFLSIQKKERWDFNKKENWIHSSQDKNPLQQCEYENGHLKIWTTAHSLDRKKMRTPKKQYSTGRYRWKTYIPKLEPFSKVSIGSWIYCDDQHEIDFEVGYGKKSEREKYNVQPHELLAYMTTQGNPFSSIAVPIAPGWHIFEIDLSLKDNKYLVKWFIDGIQTHSIQQSYGNEFNFYIFCSVENLNFIGDQLPTQDHAALFDFVEYSFHN